MKSIKTMRTKLIFSHLFILMAAMMLFESFLIFSVKRYYYDNITQMLKKQVELSAKIYTSYLSGDYIRTYYNSPIDIFKENTAAQVQLIDSDGQVIDDSEIETIGKKVETEDVGEALDGVLGVWEGRQNGIPVISVSYPVVSDKSNIDVIRFTSSLKEANLAVNRIIMFLILVSIMIILAAGAVSIIISSSITTPLIRIRDAAARLASGRLDTRVSINSRDETGQLAETFNLMASKINEHEQLKNEFISSISHELRTPLTSIKGWTQTLRFSDLNEKSEILDGLNIIENETNRLAEMVNQLLDISRFQAGRVILNKTDVDIALLLKYLAMHISTRAAKKNITLKVDYNSEMIHVNADRERLLQVLLNILDNSIKFTQSGGFINITAESGDKNIIISIEDSGCGIGAAEFERVTEKFYKGNSSKGGCGLGLAICKEIIDFHSGDLKIYSTPDKGTRVQIFLPL